MRRIKSPKASFPVVDIHVILALCYGSGEIMGTDEQFDGTALMGEFLGKRQGLTHQTGNALAQRGVEALEVIGCAGQRAERPVLRGVGLELFC